MDRRSKVIQCPSLPTLPTVAVEVLELTRDENVVLAAIAKSIQNDQALTSKILRTVNSSYYGLTTPCPSIARALTYLGLNTVKSLVLSFSLVECFRQSDSGQSSFDYTRHWRRSLYSACAARSIAQATQMIDPEEAFIASLLQDIGALAMHIAMKAEYDEINTRCHLDHETLAPLERQVFGLDHAEAGGDLAERWRLPPALVEAIRHHHQPERARDEHQPLMTIISLARAAAETLSIHRAATSVESYFTDCQRRAGLDRARATELLEQIADGASELSRLFKLNTGPAANVAMILSEAGEALLEHQIDVDRQSSRLKRHNKALAIQAETDPLTGVKNRGCFDTILAEQFDLAVTNERSIAVLFVDADHFKSINDHHGHRVGDVVLIELARRLTNTVGEAGTVYRYGGEEFAIIVPGYTRAAAGMLGESIRRSTSSEPIAITGIEGAPEVIPVTLSIGVAVHDPDTAALLREATDLVQAADKAVYSAKAAGRNCVRIFNPKRIRPATDIASLPEKPLKNTMPLDAEVVCVPRRGATAAQGEPFRVLLVEDDPMHVRLLQAGFSHAAHVELVIARSGEAAINILRNGIDGLPYRADLVLTDLRLPGISGLDVLRAVKTSGSLRMLPVIVMSASDFEEDAAACLNEGANAYLPKRCLADGPVKVVQDLIGFWSRARLVA